MKTELIAKLEELLLKDAGEVAADVRALQKEYQKYGPPGLKKPNRNL